MDDSSASQAPPAVFLPGALPVPLWGRGGVVGWTWVEFPDYSWVMGFRWHLDEGYAVRNMSWREPGGKGKRQKLHRMLLGLVTGDGRLADHENRDRLDNRRSNLRAVTRKQNAHNQKVNARAGRSSKLRGVSRRKGTDRWQAYCRVDGHLHHLGFFATEAEAGEVAAAFRREHMSHTTD